MPDGLQIMHLESRHVPPYKSSSAAHIKKYGCASMAWMYAENARSSAPVLFIVHPSSEQQAAESKHMILLHKLHQLTLQGWPCSKLRQIAQG